MKITQKGIIFSGENTPSLSSCTFPSVCQLEDGTILASFKGAKNKGPLNAADHAMTCISRDSGKTWSNAIEFFQPPIVDGKPTTLRTIYFVEVDASNLLAVLNAVDATLEELPYYNEKTEGLKDTYIMVSHSSDGGKTWSEMQRVQVEAFYDLPLPLTGAPFITSDGRVGIQFEVNKPYYETEYWVHHSAIVYSEDGGYTWGNEVIVTDNPTVYYWDQRVDVLNDGTIADIFWTFDRDKGDYVNIHYCQSNDGGRTFGPMIDTGLSGQPGNVINGKNDTLITVYINRDSVPEIRLAESHDHGETWQDVLSVFTYGRNVKGKQNSGMNDVWAEMALFSIGHPFMKRMQDGTIWVYFYNGPATDRTDFCYVAIEEKNCNER